MQKGMTILLDIVITLILYESNSGKLNLGPLYRRKAK